jgi:hypothetical protein
MIKFNDLKKMGEDLLDSAKTVKFQEVFDKFKKKEVVLSDEVAQKVHQDLQKTLETLNHLHQSQTETLHQLHNQVNDLLQFLDRFQNTLNPQGTENHEPKK